MAKPFTTFREDLLVALVAAADDSDDLYLDPRQVSDQAGLQYSPGWVRRAIGMLEKRGFVEAKYAKDDGPDDGMFVEVTGEGVEEAEAIQEERGRRDQGFTEQVPASDRYVTIDHNSAQYLAADSKIGEALDAVRGNNDYAASDPEDHEQRVAELESGRRLLKARRVRLDAVVAVLLRSLRYLAEKFADHAISMIATAALTALAALLSLPL